MNETHETPVSGNEVASSDLLVEAQAGIDRAKKEFQNAQEIIGAMMRQKRLQKEITLREMARRLNCSAPYLVDLELGRRNWSLAWITTYNAEISSD